MLVSLRLRDVQALPPRDVVLVFESDEGAEGPAVFRLRLSADADNSRLHLQQGRLVRAKGPTGPFFRRLEEELAGARLKGLTQVRSDRIVLLEFEDTPGREKRFLLGELTGRHANLILLDRKDEVLDVLVPAPTKQQAPRIEVGRTWSAPPGAPMRTSEPPTIEDDYAIPETPPPSVLAGHPARAPLSWRVEGVLGRAASERDANAARKKLRKRIERKESRAATLLNGLKKKLEACEQAERTRLDGELLTANLHLVRRGQEFVEVEDWYAADAPKRRIELDPRRGPKENVEHLFERYKKLERTRLEIPEEIRRAQKRFDQIQELLAQCDDEDVDAEELEERAVADGLLEAAQVADPRKRKAPAPRQPYLTFTSVLGTEIRVGRTARDNDALTFKHANGNDLWLHTADAPGSHVILRISGKKQGKGAASRVEPDHEDLLDAAHLAVHFSPLRGSTKASVHVALQKLVHKPRGAKPGLVTLSGGRKLELRMQPERLARLVRPER